MWGLFSVTSANKCGFGGGRNTASLLPDESSVVLLVMFNAGPFSVSFVVFDDSVIFRVSVTCADAVPLTEERILNIASNLGEDTSKHLLLCVCAACEIHKDSTWGTVVTYLTHAFNEGFFSLLFPSFHSIHKV